MMPTQVITGFQPEDITWQFIDDGDGISTYKAPTITLHSTGYITDPVTSQKIYMGGSGVDVTTYVPVKSGHHYRWRWTKVDTHNGVQVYIPFDGYNYTVKCQSKIIGSKVDQNNTRNTALKNIKVTLYKKSGATYSSFSQAGMTNPQNTANTFTFSPLNSGTYQVSVDPSTYPAGVTYVGYTICINKTSCHTTQAKTASVNAQPINIISPTTTFYVPTGQYADVWFHFNVPTPATYIQHKFYSANGIDMLKDYVRDK